MIIVRVENSNIEKALSVFKKKCNRVGVIKELRERQFYEKPSVRKRLMMEKAKYVQKKYKSNID
jgi:small subunit ribosomal protein S21